jgi:ferredoxin-type protein NapH
VQVFSFALILYAVFIYPYHVRSPLMEIEPGTPRTTIYPRDRILWVSGKECIIELYLPVLACRFVAQGGTFKSCSLHLLSENITWRTSLKLLVPHLTFLAVLSFLFARGWCGWVCPLGAIEDVMSWLRRTLKIGPWRLSADWTKLFARLRQVLLWLSLGIAALTVLPAVGRTGVKDSLFLFYCQLCPARLVYPPLGGVNPCWYDFTNGITMFLTFVGWLTLGVFVLSFMVPRLWCRLCAVGALLSYFNRGGMMTLEKDLRKCNSCGTCRRVCPLQIERVYRERENPIVTDAQCTLCGRCVETCPQSDCLSLRFAGRPVVTS